MIYGRTDLKIFMTGATGFVAKHLIPALQSHGHRVVPLGRRELAQGPAELAQQMRDCETITNLDFTRSLGSAMHRPALLRVPGLLLQARYGEGAEVMTSGRFVVSERVPESGFRFQYPYLEPALHTIVEQANAQCPVSGGFRSTKWI
jgi:NAD dependent epimerase/dehydratase family enzyme